VKTATFQGLFFKRIANMHNNRSEQQQVDVFEDISSEATKDNTVTKEEKEREDKTKRLEEDIKLGNDPLDW
jgi:hypothetical protein